MNARSQCLRRTGASEAAAILLAALAWIVVPVPRARGQDSAKPEITSQEGQPSFRLRVQRNEVMVRVVVRDAKGQVVRGLQKDDFRILDNRHPELITHFSFEGSAVPASAKLAPESASAASGGAGRPTATRIVLPARFMALFFDDVHLQFGDLTYTRSAAARYIDSNLHAGDRAAIFTSSGQDQVDFTDDREALHADLEKLRPRPVFPVDQRECPPVTPFEAYKIIHENDQFALQAAQADAFICHCEETGRASDPQCRNEATNMVMSAALRSENRSDNEARYAMQGLRRVCERMAALPGQHTVVLVSPGFLTLNQTFDVSGLEDLALRQNTVISTIDARGLYVLVPRGDATERPLVIVSRPDLETAKVLNQNESAERDADVMEELASATGGVYFHNNNDLNQGFRLAGSFPEASYVLTFAPENLKLDGRLHTLKVTLASNPGHYTVQARRGYFAPTKLEDTATLAKEQLEEMIFSQEESQTIPLQIHTQYFEGGAGAAKISVVAHVDVKGLRFRKAEGRNMEDLTVVTVLFDHQGNYVTGEQKLIQFRLLDSTLDRLTRTGLSMKASLAAKPGTYLVREVVQESEGGAMSASNSQVEIP